MARDGSRTAGTDEYAAFMLRCMRSIGDRARAGELDTTSLTQLRELRNMLDEQTADVVRALRSADGGAYSWQAIGDALGMTRAGAQQKFGSAPTDARRRGGQPGQLR